MCVRHQATASLLHAFQVAKKRILRAVSWKCFSSGFGGVAWGWLSTVTHQRNNLISFPTAVTELILGCLPSKSYIRGPAPPLKYRTCRLLFSIFVFGKHKKLMEWRKQSERVSFYLLCQAFGEERSGHKGKHGVYMIFSTLDLPTWRFRSLPRVPCSEGLPGALHPNKPL